MGGGDDSPVMLVVRICAVLGKTEFVDHVCGTAFTSREGILDDTGVSIPVNWDIKLQ